MSVPRSYQQNPRDVSLRTNQGRRDQPVQGPEVRTDFPGVTNLNIGARL